MAFDIYSFTDDNNQTAYYAVVKMKFKRRKIRSSCFFEYSDKATARQWAKIEEMRLKILYDKEISQMEKLKYEHETALLQNSHAKAFDELLRIMRGSKKNEISEEVC